MLFSGRPTVFRVEALEPNVTLVEVNGHLQGPAIGHWTALLNRVIAEGATGIVVDLRGCTTIDSACQSALLETSSAIKAKADGCVRLVAFPDVTG